MKTRRQIAATVLNRRNQISPFVMSSEMQESLGPDGFAEAMRLGWLRPDMESGGIHVSNLHQRIQEMREAVDSEKPEIGDDVTIAEQGQSYTGKVAKVNPDGSYGLTFDPARKPPATKESYTTTEFQIVKPEGRPGSPNDHIPGQPLVRYAPGSASPMAA